MSNEKNIKDYFDFSKLSKQSLGKGKVIISDPFLSDDYFTRSVVLLCDHKEEGSFGFVLNNFIEQPIHEIVEPFPPLNSKVSIGGPVETNLLFFIHTKPDLVEDSIQITDNIYMGGSFEQIQQLIELGKIKEGEIRFFLGYSGWGEKQLEEELHKNAWFVANVSEDTIMTYDHKNMWEKLLENMSKKHKVISSFPSNPNLN